MKNITSIDIAEALMSVSVRIGIPKEILSDNGPQFTTDFICEVHQLIGIKPTNRSGFREASCIIDDGQYTFMALF